MQTYFECIPCFIRQAIDVVKLITDNEEVHEKVLRKVLADMSGMDLLQSPPAMARHIHRVIKKQTGVADAYKEVKQKSNEFALRLYPELKEIVDRSDRPFETAVRLAIAGNIIDFGVHTATLDFDEEQVHRSIKDALGSSVDRKYIEHLREEIDRAASILYLADNAGEIVFDRLLLDQMPTDKVTLAVRGGPIINDVTMEDAEMTGITDIVKVIDNGTDAPGTILELCSEKFRNLFNTSDLIIAKGQGNYETLSDETNNLFFLLKAKCPVIARHLGVEIGDIVIRKKQNK